MCCGKIPNNLRKKTFGWVKIQKLYIKKNEGLKIFTYTYFQEQKRGSDIMQLDFEGCHFTFSADLNGDVWINRSTLLLIHLHLPKHQSVKELPTLFFLFTQHVLFFNAILPLHIRPSPPPTYKTHYTPPTASARSFPRIIWWPSAWLSLAFQKPRGLDVYLLSPVPPTLSRMQNVSVLVAATISAGAAVL